MLILILLLTALLHLVQWESCSGEASISARTSTVENLPDQITVGHTQNFTIVGKDFTGENMLHGGSIWSVRFVGPVYVIPHCITDQGNGQYRVSFMLPQPGTYSLQIELKYQEINTSSNTTCARNRSKVFKLYTACNPKSEFYVNVDGLSGCDHNNLESVGCIASTKKYIECMDRVKDVCQYPHLIKERMPEVRAIRALTSSAPGGGVVSPSTTRPCFSRASALGAGHWVNVTLTCVLDRAWEEAGFSSVAACRDAVYPCPPLDNDDDELSLSICKADLIWRPNTCFLSPVKRHTLEQHHRHFFFYGISTLDEIARRMRDFFKPESVTSLRNIRTSGEIPWRKHNTTFVLHACGEQVATTLTLTLFDRQRRRSCQVMLRHLHNLIHQQQQSKHTAVATSSSQHTTETSSPSAAIDIIYQRHPVNYPRNAHSPAEIKRAIGRYPGSRGYMSVNELLTDFYYDIMQDYTTEQVPISGILNQQAMTESLWGDFGDGLHYDNQALRFVLDHCVLLLATSSLLPSVAAAPSRHDPLLHSCPSSFRARGMYSTSPPAPVSAIAPAAIAPAIGPAAIGPAAIGPAAGSAGSVEEEAAS
jgi:hypothetical protein